MNWIWQTVLIFIVGTTFLRIGGRKSISQMTMPQTIIMISLGTLIIQPVTGLGLWTTFGVAALLVCALVITEIIQIKSDKLERIISGNAVAVIHEGQTVKPNLRKLRLTVDKLETRLRQQGIASINDVQSASLEVSGQLGYILKPEKQPATKEDIQKIMQLLNENRHLPTPNDTKAQNNIFSEATTEESSPPKYLQ